MKQLLHRHLFSASTLTLGILVLCLDCLTANAAENQSSKLPESNMINSPAGPTSLPDSSPSPISTHLTSLTPSYSEQDGAGITGHYRTQPTPQDAIMVESTLAEHAYRYAVTWGHALNTTQRFKLTGEHLSANTDYQFTSGEVSHWTGQNAFGADYEVLLGNAPRWLKTVNIASYYSKSNSTELSPAVIDDGAATNFRHIAGGTAHGTSGGIAISPSQNTLLKTTLNYDTLNYHTNFSSPHNKNGFGETLSLQQRLLPRLKVSVMQSARALYNSYGADVTWLAYAEPGKKVTFSVGAQHVNSNAASNNDNRIGLTLAYHWAAAASNAESFAVPSLKLAESLATWTDTPAVHMQQVLTRVDQRTASNAAAAMLPQQASNTASTYGATSQSASCPGKVSAHATTITVDGATLTLTNERRGPEYSVMLLKTEQSGNQLTCVYQDTFLAYDYSGTIPNNLASVGARGKVALNHMAVQHHLI